MQLMQDCSVLCHLKFLAISGMLCQDEPMGYFSVERAAGQRCRASVKPLTPLTELGTIVHNGEQRCTFRVDDFHSQPYCFVSSDVFAILAVSNRRRCLVTVNRVNADPVTILHPYTGAPEPKPHRKHTMCPLLLRLRAEMRCRLVNFKNSFRSVETLNIPVVNYVQETAGGWLRDGMPIPLGKSWQGAKI